LQGIRWHNESERGIEHLNMIDHGGLLAVQPRHSFGLLAIPAGVVNATMC
jgi:hypothetical protein